MLSHSKLSNILVVTALFVCLLAYFPFLYASQYLYPLGYHEWDWISCFSGADLNSTYFEIQQHWYDKIGGRYSSTALLGTFPFWYNLFLFRIIAIAFLILLPLSLIWLIKQLGLKKISWILFASIWVLYLDQLTNIYDTLLRPTCMPIYHLGLMGVFVFAGLIWSWKQSNYKKMSTAFIAVIIGLITVGTNEISLVHLSVIGSCAILFYIKDKRLIPWQLVVVMTIIGIAIIFSITAPGNFARQSQYPEPSIIKGIFLSLSTSLFLWTEWLTNSLLLPMTAIWIWIYFQLLSVEKRRVFTHPKRWFFVLVMLTPLSLFPLLYGTGGASLPERLVDLLFLCTTLLFIGFLFSVLTLYNAKNNLPLNLQAGFLSRLTFILIGSFISLNLFFGGLSINRDPEVRSKGRLELIEINANIGIAYLQIFKGIPQQYSKEMQSIETQILECGKGKCLVDPITTSEFIGYDPIYDRMWRKGEKGMSWFLGKHEIEAVFYEK